MQALEEYRKPRDALLILVSDFIRICAPRLEELEEASLPPRYTVPELLDHISVNVSVVIKREMKKNFFFFYYEKRISVFPRGHVIFYLLYQRQ